MDRSVIIALVIFVFLWIVILKYCIETNDWTGFIYLRRSHSSYMDEKMYSELITQRYDSMQL